MGFAIHPAPAGGRSGAAVPAASSAGTTPASSARTSSTSSLDGSTTYDSARCRSPPAPPPGHTLQAPSRRHRTGRHGSRSARLLQKLRHAIPVLTLTTRCGRLLAGPPSAAAATVGSHAAPLPGAARPCRRVTGTLYGHRKGRVALALQESPRCLPSLVVELALQTHALLRELGNPAGARIILEAERRAAGPDAAAAAGETGGRRKKGTTHAPLLDEPVWTMFCNGRKTGYAVRREATDDDLRVLETLRPVSMGAGVLPGRSSTDAAADDEVPYMRGCFDHFVGSRDSESLYMVPPPQGGGSGPELAVFFVRP